MKNTVNDNKYQAETQIISDFLAMTKAPTGSISSPDESACLRYLSAVKVLLQAGFDRLAMEETPYVEELSSSLLEQWHKVPGSLFNLKCRAGNSTDATAIRWQALNLLDNYYAVYKSYRLQPGEILYFAYGSNMNQRQMASRCSGSRLVGPGIMKDFKLVYRYSSKKPYASIDCQPGSFVPILIWVINENDLKSLDRYEGVGVEGAYRRLTGTAYFGRTQYAGLYYALPESRPFGRADQPYIDDIREQYHRWGFNYIWEEN